MVQNMQQAAFHGWAAEGFGSVAQVAAAWEARHEKEGVAVFEMLLELGGLYVKSSQILASKGDFVPEPWVGARLALPLHPSQRRMRACLPAALHLG